MNDVNWWLMALAFVLGLALTLAFMVRRVVREVPVYGAAGASAAANLVGAKPKAAEADAICPRPSCRRVLGRRCGARSGGAADAGAAKSSVRKATVTKNHTAQARCGWRRFGRRAYRLHDQGQRGLEALSHAGQPLLRGDGRRAVVPRRGDGGGGGLQPLGQRQDPNASGTRRPRTGLGVAAAAGRRPAGSAPMMLCRRAIRPAGQPVPGQGPSRSATPSILG